MNSDSSSLHLDSLFATNVSNSTGGITTPIGQVTANLVVDAITILLTFIFLIPLLVVYVKRNCYLYFKFLALGIVKYHCFTREPLPSSGSSSSSDSFESKTKSKGIFFSLIHSLVLFVVFRMGAEGVSIIQHVYELNRDRPNYLTTVSVRRILDYISIYWYILNYSLLIPIWLKVCLAWIADKKRKKIATGVIYTLLALSNLSALCGLIPVVILSIIALSASSGENESLRRTLTFAVGVPLVGIGTAIVFLFGIIAVVAIVLMLRSSAKYTPSDSEVYRLQLQSMMKLTVGVVIMSLGAVLEVVGIVTNYLEMPNFIVYPLAKGVPYITFMICISLIFWPYRLPLLSHPIQFVTQELRFSPKTKEATLVDVAQVEHEMK